MCLQGHLPYAYLPLNFGARTQPNQEKPGTMNETETTQDQEVGAGEAPPAGAPPVSPTPAGEQAAPETGAADAAGEAQAAPADAPAPSTEDDGA